jgi:hypothetical protein
LNVVESRDRISKDQFKCHALHPVATSFVLARVGFSSARIGDELALYFWIAKKIDALMQFASAPACANAAGPNHSSSGRTTTRLSEIVERQLSGDELQNAIGDSR